jgi:hypothetical protein
MIAVVMMIETTSTAVALIMSMMSLPVRADAPLRRFTS